MIKNKSFFIFFIFIAISLHFPVQAMELECKEQTNLSTVSPIRLFVDEILLPTSTMPPIQLGDVTFVPLKEILECLNATYEWKNFEKRIYISYEDTLIVLEIDQLEVWINGETIPLQTPAQIIHNKIMVPLRFLSEQMGYTVSWIGGDLREIHLTKTQTSLPSLPDISLDPYEPIAPNLPSQNSPDHSSFITIEYEASLSPLIKLSKKGNLKLSQLTCIDAYRERQLIIDLGDTYSFLLDEDSLVIEDSYIKNIQILNHETTRLIINEAKVQAYDLYEDDEWIYIQLIPPSEKYDYIIFLDPGHGQNHPGSVAHGIIEKHLNLRQALALQSLLEADNTIKVYMSREDDLNHFSTVQEELLYRTQLANEIGADLFISMHNNSSAPEVSGTEIFYYNDDFISKQIATLTQHNIITMCGTKNRGAKPNNDLFVLLNTTMPSILIESGFITNEIEASLLQTDTFNEQLSLAIFLSLLEASNLLQ